jgi:hypothetical protein
MLVSGDSIEVRLEHRLTKVEEAIVSNTAALDRVALHVAAQNGRLGKLESFRDKALAVVALAVASGPFIFFALDRAFPQ